LEGDQAAVAEPPGGAPRELSLRHTSNATLDVLKTGSQWRQLPRDVPPGSAVYDYVRRWRRDGIWIRLHDTLRARLRQRSGRHKHPSAGCLDSQSVKTAAIPGERGYDADKKSNGRKRHIPVDTPGLLRVVLVTAASVQDRDGARQLLHQLPGPCKQLRTIRVDGGCSGRLVDWVAERFRFVLAVLLRPKESRRFVVLPRRWVVARTVGWLNLSRRLSKDYGRLVPTSETRGHPAMIRLMANRLA
jgi:putative transposase